MLTQRHRGAGDFQQFLRDVRLAQFVVFERQVLDELLRVVGRILHRHHARAVLAGLGFQQNLVNLEIQVVRQQRAQHRLRVRLEQKFRRALQQLLAPSAAVHAGRDAFDFADRQERHALRASGSAC